MTNHEKAIRIARESAKNVMKDVRGLMPLEDAARIDGARIAVHTMAAWLQTGERLTGTVHAALHEFDGLIRAMLGDD